MTKEEVDRSFAHLDVPNAPVRANEFYRWFDRLLGGEQHGYSRIFLKLLIRRSVFAFYTIAVIDQLEPDEYKAFKAEFDKIKRHING